MTPMRVLAGCETSGVVRRAFAALGHDAWSCDLEPAEDGSNRHIRDDIRNVLHLGWDLLAVMTPPCTRLCNSGVRWLSQAPPGRTLDEMWAELRDGAKIFSACLNAPIDRIAVENPIMHHHAYRPPAQWLQPFWFGHGETKRLGLWLKNLKPLQPTEIVECRYARVHRMTGWQPQAQRRRARSRFLPGIATAMADQWGKR